VNGADVSSSMSDLEGRGGGGGDVMPIVGAFGVVAVVDTNVFVFANTHSLGSIRLFVCSFCLFVLFVCFVLFVIFVCLFCFVCDFCFFVFFCL
jgi:hypothetical protein